MLYSIYLFLVLGFSVSFFLSLIISLFVFVFLPVIRSLFSLSFLSCVYSLFLSFFFCAAEGKQPQQKKHTPVRTACNPRGDSAEAEHSKREGCRSQVK